MPQPFHGIHLVGSMPFNDAEELFEYLATSGITKHLARIPEETGDRAGWITLQMSQIMDNPATEIVAPLPDAPIPMPRAKLKDGLTAADFELAGGFAYGPATVKSYEVFRAAKADGKIRSDARLQVSMAGPQNPIGLFVGDDRSQHEIEKAYDIELKKSVKEVLAAVPHEELAIQWDLVSELESIQPRPGGGARSSFTADNARRSIKMLAGWVPEDVELGFHLCYGDTNRDNIKPGVKTPFDAQAVPAEAAYGLRATLDAIFDSVERRVDYVHLAIPLTFVTAAEFAPLEGVEIPDKTDLYLGLVHPQDASLDVPRQRAVLASAAFGGRPFGIATECGVGRYEYSKFEAAIEQLGKLADEYDQTGVPA